MIDKLSQKMMSEIVKIAEEKLRRPLTEKEEFNINKPRSYLALEMIIDFLRDTNLNNEEIEKYIGEL